MTPTLHADCLRDRVRRAIRLTDSLLDEAVGHDSPSLSSCQIDLLERRLAEIRFVLEEPGAATHLVASQYSPAPWSYEYSPYRCNDGREIPAFEVYDGNGDKVFDTNEDSDANLQEANARLAAAAPSLRLALSECLRLLADFEGDDSEEGRAYSNGLVALAEAGGSCR